MRIRTSFQDLERLLRPLIISCFIVCVCHAVFYSYSALIWSVNPAIPLEDYSPRARDFIDPQDGIEIYVVYTMTLISMISAVVLSRVLCAVKSNPLATALLFAATLIYLYKFIGVHVPMSTGYRAPMISQPVFFIGFAFVIIVLSQLEKLRSRLLWPLVAVVLIPLCFVPTAPLIWEDASYLFIPALKLIHGTKLSQIYFQYDSLLSFLAAVWLKFDLAPHMFRLVGQCSLFGLILGLGIFSRALFRNKVLSVYLIVALVICKIYANLADPTAHLQVVPLRLDLWVILLCLLYFKGPYHKALVCTCALLMVAHHAFGMIYFLCYCQLICILAFADIRGFMDKQKTSFAVRDWAKKHFQLNFANILILLTAMVLYPLIFKNSNEPDASFYLGLKIGFLPIARTSFYWLILILFCACATLTFKCREFIGERLFQTHLFLLLLAAGQSIYFFGRSHENNIVNLSAVYVLCFFVFLDLISRFIQKDGLKDREAFFEPVSSWIALLFIFGAVYCYQDQIINKSYLRYYNFLSDGTLGSRDKVIPNLDLIKKIAGDNSKVYFMMREDFLYYYYGHYDPVGYFSPYHSQVLKKRSVAFLKELLFKGYILIAKTDDDTSLEMVRELKSANVYSSGEYYFLSKIDLVSHQDLTRINFE